MKATRHADYSMASRTLTTALLASIGEKNRNHHLKTTFPALKLYMLSPREIVDTMRAKHGVATSDDVSRLLDPLSRALTSILQQSLATLFPFLENLTDHLTRGDPSSPFSGAAKALQRPATRNRQPRSRPNNNNNRTKQQQQPAGRPRTVPVTPTPETTKKPVGDRQQ
jgi:hypothetical protein